MKKLLSFLIDFANKTSAATYRSFASQFSAVFFSEEAE
jgi:hypothetical protein